MSAPLRIANRDARRLWLWTNGLSATPTGPLDVMGMIRALGFVQIDTIRNVTRAHHHILWSRNQNYREKMLWPRLKGRDLFEHFTHDASLIPMEVLPYWQRQFDRLGRKAAASDVNCSRTSAAMSKAMTGALTRNSRMRSVKRRVGVKNFVAFLRL